MALASWRIDAAGPIRLPIGAIDLEKHLEGWIESDPTLVDSGLLVIGRQLRVEGGILDLLCVDPSGRATVVEIKRGKLIRDTIAQGIDYAASISRMPVDELRAHATSYLDSFPSHPGLGSLLDESGSDTRDVAVVVVGVGADPGLERIIDHLGSGYGVPIRAVTFDVFDLGDGTRILVRDVTEPEPEPDKPSSGATRDAVLAAAGGPTSAVGRRMQKILDAGETAGLYAKPWKWSFTLGPQSHKNRALVTFGRFDGGEGLSIAYYADAIAEFYPVDPDQVRSQFVDPDRVTIPIQDDIVAELWAGRIREFFSQFLEKDPSTETMT